MRLLLRAGAASVLCAAVLLASAFARPAAAEGENALPPGGADPATGTHRAVIRFLTEGDYPPFNFFDEEGALIGFNADLARALCVEIGAACDLGVRPWEELLPALRRGEADAVIAGHAITPKALAVAEFTDHYFHLPGRFAARRDEPAGEPAPETLDGRRVAVVKGTAHEAFIKAFFPYCVLQSFASADLARDALMQGRSDFLFDDAVSLAFWLNGTNSRQCCEFRGGAYLEPYYFGEGLAIAVPKSDPQIRRLLNEALRRLRDNGRMEELVQRYFPYRIY